MEETLKSHWYLPYDQVIIKAQAIQPHFAADLPEFNAYNRWFTVAVNTQLLSGIYRGQKDFSESNWMVEIKRTINLLDIKMLDAHHCYEELNYYVFVAFGDATVNNETFGYSGFAQARSSVRKMIDLLNQALAAISYRDNETRLLSAYMPLELPIQMKLIVADLTSRYGELKILKKQHLIITRERIDLYNSIWDTLSKISEDAKIIFANDPYRLAFYELFDTEEWNVDEMEFMHLN